MNETAKKVAIIGISAALGTILTFLAPLFKFPPAPFLEYEPGDVPAIFTAFFFGPLSGLIVITIISVIQALTISSGSLWYGMVMHIIASGTFIITAGLIYRIKHNKKGALLGLATGAIMMTLIMIPANYFITPIYLQQVYGMPPAVAGDEVRKLILSAIIPFNLMKGFLNSVITLLIYKSISTAAHSFIEKPVFSQKEND